MPTTSNSSQRSTRSRRPGELARLLSAETGTSYQRALEDVRSASAQGRLPQRLDTPGIDLALRTLLQRPMAPWAPGLIGTPWPDLYHPLTTSLPGTRSATALAHLARAQRTLRPGQVSETDSGYYSPEYLDQEMGFRRQHLHEHPAGLHRDIATWLLDSFDADGPLPQFLLPSPYGNAIDLPVDQALLLWRDGDPDEAEHLLKAAVQEHPWDIDAYAHLGALALERHDGRSEDLIAFIEPDLVDQDRHLHEALGWYEAAVAVGEALLPERFVGRLPKDDQANNWFLRGLGGLAKTLWRMRRYLSAEQVLVTMIYLNPLDNYGARDLLPFMISRTPWRHGLVDRHTQRTTGLGRTRGPAAYRRNTVRCLLDPATKPTEATTKQAVMLAVAHALDTRWEWGTDSVTRGGLRISVSVQRQNGQSAEPDVHWWDAHPAGQHPEGPLLLVLVGDNARILVAQLLLPGELADYLAAPLPRRDRCAFTSTFVHGATDYGQDLTSMVDHALDEVPIPL